MKNLKVDEEKYSKLRSTVEKKLNCIQTDLKNTRDEITTGIEELLQELQIHQIKLERQTDELQKAQLTIEESIRNYFSLFNSAPVGYLTINEKGVILEANLKVAAMLDTERSNLVKKRFTKYIINEDHNIFYEHLKSLQNAASCHSCELRMLTKHNNVFWVVLESVIDAEGERDYTKIRISVTDITALRQKESELEESRGNLSIEIECRKKAEKQIKENLDEKEILLQELYHRTKNNMQIIHSIMMLSSRKYLNEEVDELVRETGSRIQAMAMVHNKLYQSKNLSHINLHEYFEELSGLLIGIYNTTCEKISLVLEIENFYVLIDTAIPLGLVVNELMSNALKYAFPCVDEGEVVIKISQNEFGKMDFIFSDNGIGLPDGFDFRKQKTLGYKLITGIVEEQMNGNISFISADGLTCHIEFSDTLYEARV